MRQSRSPGLRGEPSPVTNHPGRFLRAWPIFNHLPFCAWPPPLLVAGLSLGGCFSTDTGPSPPAQQFYFPTGLAVSPGGKALIVANSDFDLQFSAGTVQLLDLARLKKLLPPLKDGKVDCAAAGLSPNAPQDQLLFPGPCTALNVEAPPDGQGSLVKATATIGAFVSDALVVRRPPVSSAETVTEARLLLPVRGDPSMTWMSIDDDTNGEQSFRLECGQGSGARCGDDHRAGIDATTNLRDLTLPGEPFAIAASDDTSAIVISHQTSGAVSLLLNGWATASGPQLPKCQKLPSVPTLSYILSGLSTGVTGVAALPQPRVSALFPDEFPFTPGFLVGYRTASEIDIIRYYDDCAAAPSRPFLSVSSRVGVTVSAGGYDSRSIALDNTPRRTCEDSCDAADKDCLARCAGVPIDVFVANRTPPSLLVGKATGGVSQYGTDDSVTFGDLIPLAQGASRVVLGKVLDRNGTPRARAFVLCFDARLMYVIDPEVSAVEAIVTTGRGPSALVFDANLATSSFAYLAHFTDSYLSVLDLDMRHPSTYLTLIANVGVPSPPRESR